MTCDGSSGYCVLRQCTSDDECVNKFDFGYICDARNHNEWFCVLNCSSYSGDARFCEDVWPINQKYACDAASGLCTPSYFILFYFVSPLLNPLLMVFANNQITETSFSSPSSPEQLEIFEHFGFKDAMSFYMFISFVCIAIVVCGMLIGYLSFSSYHHQRNPDILHVRNAMVLLIAISDYDDDIEKEDRDIHGYLPNLHGLDHDVNNMMELFGDELNFDVFPAPNQQYEWTQNDLKCFLEEKAEYLDNNIVSGRCYDGLVVIVSSHGVPYKVCTSDYKTFSKVAIHRMFSLGRQHSRTIPRFFLFDCCSGGNQRECAESEGDEFEAAETGKHFSAEHIGNGAEQPWLVGESNPDYMLARVEAANLGFQSKLNKEFGSYVIYAFYVKSMENVKRKQPQFIEEMFYEIQDELHSLGKQNPEYIWNNNTKYIMFGKNEKRIHDMDEEKTALKMANVTEMHMVPDQSKSS